MPPRSARGRTTGPADVLRDAEAALESGERRQRSGEDDKAIKYFQSVCGALADVRDDRTACLLWATAMTNLVALQAPAWRDAMDGAPDLRLAASALERGHAAAVAARAPSDELAHLLSVRAECATLLAEQLAEDCAAAVRWAAEAARLWEQSLAEELSASTYDVPEATVETMCGLGSASMAFGKLVLGGAGSAAVDTTTRRAAQAAVKRALDAFEEACGLCDSACGARGRRTSVGPARAACPLPPARSPRRRRCAAAELTPPWPSNLAREQARR